MYIIHVDYTEGDPNSYNGIYITRDGEEILRYNQGLGKWNFLTDWTRVVVWAKKTKPEMLYASSTLHDYGVLVGVELNI